MQKFRWFLDHFEEVFMVLSLMIIVVAMFTGVFFRYVLNSALTWPEEVSRYFLILLAFSGLSYGVRTKTHLRIDVLELALPVLKKPLELIGDLVVVAFCIFMLGPAHSNTIMIQNSGQISPALMMPMYIVYIPLLVAFILAIVRTIEKYIKYLLQYVKSRNEKFGKGG
ncbi:MAG: TRAP transporter small permease [Spirochaetes bacterium]|nr:TRAP transporter small permease [Spirochaetota bacterium]